MAEPDQLAIEACVRGDARAWAALVGQYQPLVAKQMWRFSRERRVWEELVQDVLVELFYSLPNYRPTGVPFEHWVRRIATRVGYRHWKQAGRKRAGGSIPDGRRFADDPASAAPQPIEAMEASDAAALLHGLLAELPAADRLVLTLLYFEQCDVREIARQTAWNAAMVKMRLMRARRKLKALVEARGLVEQLAGEDYGNRTVDRVAGPSSAA